ncbi:MAG: hypothetical protein R3C05_05780 [Pirellulaceae bacterium]
MSAVDETRANQEQLPKIADRQKQLIRILLLNIVYNIAVCCHRCRPANEVRIVGFCSGWRCNPLIEIYLVFSLLLTLRKPVYGVFLALLMFLPFINLLSLLIASSKATAVLKSNGVKVGLFGADRSTLPATDTGPTEQAD